MKSLSCISLSRTHEDPVDRHHIPIDEDKDDTNTPQGHNKGPKLQTLIEVLRCEFAKPGRTSNSPTENELGPSKQWTPLYYAVYHNREAALLHFLRAGQSADDIAEIGQPPLCVATAAGHIEIIKILCEAGANIGAATKQLGETAVHIAIKTGRNDLLNVLLSYGPNLEARALSTDDTPLHYAAAKTGALAAVADLLKSGANYEALNAKGCSPAAVALQSQNLHAAVAIINAARGKRSKLLKEKEMLLKHVEKAQNRFSMNNELIADIFEAGCPPDSTVLMEAIKRDDAGLVEMFLRNGADPNRKTTSGIQPLFAALDCSRAQIIHALAKHGADVTIRDARGLSVLQAAFESPSVHDREATSGIFGSLLSAGADPHVTYPDGTSLLHHAVRPGNALAKVSQLLLEHGVKVNGQDLSGNTAMHAAAHSRSCVAVLLKHNADTNLTNNEGLTPLLHATKSASKDEEPDLEQLIKSSDLRKVDSDGKTALHLAAQNGLEKTVRLLLQARAETTCIDLKKRTPLLLAVLDDQWSVVPLLAIQPGINSWDENGLTALHHIAMSNPKTPSTWKNIASAAAPFCGKGVSRSMRDRSGATPLIQAIKTLPEEGIPVIEVLLQKGLDRSNCIGHEDHSQRNALYYAATLGKPSFVAALLKSGTPFIFKDWRLKRGLIQPTGEINKQILKLMADHEWLRRATMLQRQSSVSSDDHILPKVLPVRDLSDLFAMGLDPNALPKTRFTSPLMWVILNQTLLPPPLPPTYLHDTLKLILSSGADANVTTARSCARASQIRSSQQQLPLTLHPLTFLIEQFPSVDISLVNLFLDHGSKLSTPSPFYIGRFPLHSAVQANRFDLVDLFLTLHTDANAVDRNGRTPLFIASEKGYWEVVDLLLRFGATVYGKDCEGDTALHAAATHGTKRIISSLLRAGAKASILNKNGTKPAACVPDNLAEKDKERILAMLKHAEEQERRMDEREKREKSTIRAQALMLKPEPVAVVAPKPAPKPAVATPAIIPPKPLEMGQTARSDTVVKTKEVKKQAIQEGKQRMWHWGHSRAQKTKSTTVAPSSAIEKPAVAPAPHPSSATKPTADSKPTKDTPVRISKQMVKIRYTPPSSKPSPPNPTPSPSTTASKPPANKNKPLPQPRVDSGINLSQRNSDSPLPVLNRNKQAFDQTDEQAARDDELSSWLEISKLIDRL